ncbi:hypothetical protein [Paraferrimonas sp. SM1919]|uniref:hypothetical protein n=1 Tax=Paraferrimonas sp. SM1919 TaxID=2662263 RepID=UPI0013D34939|nr:hypothetical protein [Paraferrimonas sp. SM1919]
MLKLILATIIIIGMTGCQSTRPTTYSNYETNLEYAKQTANFKFTEKTIYQQAELGVMLEYENVIYPADNIDVFIYPILKTNWSNSERVLSNELDDSLKQVDAAVNLGHYDSRTKATKTSFNVDQLQGKKASFSFDKNGQTYLSNTYIFLAKDKYIKFRTSFNKSLTNDWDGDQAVTEILPTLQVPNESAYMKKLRQEHAQKQLYRLLRAIQDNKNKDKDKKDTSKT